MATKTIVKYRNRTVKRKSRRRNKFTLPMSVVAPVAMIGIDAFNSAKNVDPTAGMDLLVSRFTGYSHYEGNWKLDRLKYGLLPLGIGIMIHKIAGKTGVNRTLAKAGVPWIRI